jgi:hypothetical protein
VASTGSIGNKGKSKTIIAHKQSDIDSLKDFLFGMNLTKKDSKIATNYIVSLNKDLKALEEVEENEIKEIEENAANISIVKKEQDKLKTNQNCMSPSVF